MTAHHHPVFASILCAAHNGATGYAARRQAALLASPGGAVEVVPAAALIRRSPDELRKCCKGHDLLVIADGPGAHRTLEHAPIPVMIARWCIAGPVEVAASILVVIDDRGACEQAADIAGRLAARHRGTVTLLAARRHDATLERALNAGERIVLHHTGAAPAILGRHLPLEQVIAERCASIGASLLVLGTDGAGIPRRTAADIAARVGCSVLTVPAPAPAPAPVESAERHPEMVPA